MTENLPTIKEAVQTTVNELNLIESGGGPKTWSTALRFAQMIEFVKAMHEESALTEYQRAFWLGMQAADYRKCGCGAVTASDEKCLNCESKRVS